MKRTGGPRLIPLAWLPYRLCQVQTNSSDLDDRFTYGGANKFRTNGSANKLPSQWPASHLFLPLSRPTTMRVVSARHTSCTLALEAAPLGTEA
jgi:hypothetical protein